MKKGWIIFFVIIILLAIGAYFLFKSGNNPSSNSQQYQAPNVSGTNSSALQPAAIKYNGLDLTPGQQQTDVIPPTSSNIPAP